MNRWACGSGCCRAGVMTELPGTLELVETDIGAGTEDVMLVVATVAAPVAADNCWGFVRLPSSWFKF